VKSWIDVSVWIRGKVIGRAYDEPVNHGAVECSDGTPVAEYGERKQTMWLRVELPKTEGDKSEEAEDDWC
jgi:hypothetical protein